MTLSHETISGEPVLDQLLSTKDEVPVDQATRDMGNIIIGKVKPYEKPLVDSGEPQSVLHQMLEGNKRYHRGLYGDRVAVANAKGNSKTRQNLANGQTPGAAVLSCADSRVPVEAIFDQSVGDLFVVRTAGNICSPCAEGSLDYGVKHLGVKVLMVLGHAGCGAVKAAQLESRDIKGESAALAGLLFDIKSGLQACKTCTPEIAVEVNVRHQVAALSKNPLVKSKVASGELILVGAKYDLATGQINLVE